MQSKLAYKKYLKIPIYEKFISAYTLLPFSSEIYLEKQTKINFTVIQKWKQSIAEINLLF